MNENYCYIMLIVLKNSFDILFKLKKKFKLKVNEKQFLFDFVTFIKKLLLYFEA